MSELSILIPDETIALREEKITIRPCRVHQLKSILAVVNKYLEKIAETDDAIALAKYLLEDSGENAIADIFSILTTCCSVPKKIIDNDFLENLYYDELIFLVAKFLELNKDFFARLGKTISQTITEEQPSDPKIGEGK